LKYLFAAILLLASLNGCSMLVAGVVGAAVTPLVQPLVDRVLHRAHLDPIDPGGTDAVRNRPLIHAPAAAAK
jgi:hypothetical protein